MPAITGRYVKREEVDAIAELFLDIQVGNISAEVGYERFCDIMRGEK